MPKDKKGHGSEKKGGNPRFEVGGHIIEHAPAKSAGQKMYIVGSTGNSYKNKEDAVQYASMWPTGKKKRT